jgi:hypothetical protein
MRQTTRHGDCEGGAKLPFDGPCPKCGAGPDDLCPYRFSAPSPGDAREVAPIEAVARAMCRANKEDPDSTTQDKSTEHPTDQALPRWWAYEHLARAALAALPQPAHARSAEPHTDGDPNPSPAPARQGND